VEEQGAEIREIYHDVKNHMAVVSSLIRLSASFREAGPVRDSLEETGALVSPVFLVYQHLFRNSGGGIPVQSFLAEAADTLDQLLSRPVPRIRTETDPGDIRMASRQAVPLGILVSELILYRLRSATPSGDPPAGEIRIRLYRREPGWVLEYRDGLVTGESSGTGGETLLIEGLCSQLDGESLPVENEGGQTLYRFRFPAGLILS